MDNWAGYTHLSKLLALIYLDQEVTHITLITITRVFCFCITAAARPLCLPWTTKAAVVAKQVAKRRQSEGRTIAMVAQVLPWSLNGGTVVATVIAQWTPLVDQRRHNGGTGKADVSLKLIHNVRIFYWATNADHCASILRPRRCVCLHPASFERPTSSATFVRLFWTRSKLHGVHGDIRLFLFIEIHSSLFPYQAPSKAITLIRILHVTNVVLPFFFLFFLKIRFFKFLFSLIIGHFPSCIGNASIFITVKA